MAITQEVNIEMLEKLPDGNFKIKYPKTKIENVIGGSEVVTGSFAKGASPANVTLGFRPKYLQWFVQISSNTIEIFEKFDSLAGKTILHRNNAATQHQFLDDSLAGDVEFTNVGFNMNFQGTLTYPTIYYIAIR